MFVFCADGPPPFPDAHHGTFTEKATGQPLTIRAAADDVHAVWHQPVGQHVPRPVEQEIRSNFKLSPRGAYELGPQ